MTDQKDALREAFQKIKQDISSLYSEINSLKRNLVSLNYEMARIAEILLKITENIPKKQSETHPTHQQINQTDRVKSPTITTHNPTNTSLFYKEKQLFSTGNEGVPTDRQTNQQTDNRTQNPPKNSIEDAAKILSSLDSLKKEIRLKFKQLTDQELLVFSTIYQMEEDHLTVDYKTLALKLNLTESSIREYIGRLLKKGIPIEKQKVNNKKILLSVSQNLKKIASLATILQLRDI